MSDQFSRVCFNGSHCILYHHNGSMSSSFFGSSMFLGVQYNSPPPFTSTPRTNLRCRSPMLARAESNVFGSSILFTSTRVRSPPPQKWLTLSSDCSIWWRFHAVWYLIRAARYRQPIVGGYLGVWIVLLDFSRRSRALHLLLWSIIYYWMSNKLTLRGRKRHVSLGNV